MLKTKAMATFTRPTRIVWNGLANRLFSVRRDIVVNNVEANLKILKAVVNDKATDAELYKGFEREMQMDMKLKADRNTAIQWYKKCQKKADWPLQKNNIVALRTFSLDSFVNSFNKACRDLASVREARSFKYKSFFNILLRSIHNVKGNPQKIHSSTLYRGCSARHPLLIEGEAFIFKQFTSTSLNKEEATKFTRNKGTLFIIDDVNQGIIGQQRVIGCPVSLEN